MKLHCAKCNKQLTHDLYKVSVSRLKGVILNVSAIWNKDKPVYETTDVEEDLGDGRTVTILDETDNIVGWEYSNMKSGLFYETRNRPKENNKWHDDKPAQIICKIKSEFVVAEDSMCDGVIPPFKSGYGCCNYSMGEPLMCECGNHVGSMYLDCYEDKSVSLIKDKVVRVYQ